MREIGIGQGLEVGVPDGTEGALALATWHGRLSAFSRHRLQVRHQILNTESQQQYSRSPEAANRSRVQQTSRISLSTRSTAVAISILGLLALSGCGGKSTPLDTNPGPIVNTDNYVIKAGETVSPTGPLTINASKSVTIAGSLVSSGNNGQPITINSQGDVVITGSIATGGGAFTAPSGTAAPSPVDGGTLTITSNGGNITISGTIKAGDGATPPTGTNSNGSILPADTNGGKGSNGGSILLHAPNGSITAGATAGIHIGNGGNGADIQISGQDLLTYTGTPGNTGGNSGAMQIDSPSVVGLTTVNTQIPVDFPPQNPIFKAGSTVAIVTSSNVAGGTAGNAGAFRFGVDASGNSTWPAVRAGASSFASISERATPMASLTTITQTGANGGFGWINGGVGSPASVRGQDGASPGANGQNVIAVGGNGGWGYVPGNGGNATARGGNGAAGNNYILKGGNGGTATATGGAAGGIVTGSGGNAGAIGGNGGNGGGDCTVGSVMVGGAGGTGASANATGVQAYAYGGNGGNGGNGFSRDGAGGSFGGATAVSSYGTPTQVSGKPGVNGSVCAPVLVSLVVTPATATVKVGYLIPFSAKGAFLDGSSKDLTNQVTWTTTSAGAIASIDSTAIATGVNPGTDTVVATSTYKDSQGNLIKGTASLTVVAPSSVSTRTLGGGMQSSGLVDSSGNLYFAGNNTYGQGGPNIPRQDDISTFTKEGLSFPTPPGAQIASADAATVIPLVFSTGAYHSAAVIPSGSGGSSQPASGQLYTWGSNYYGNLGDGTMNDSATPIAVSGMANVIAAAAGNGKTVAVLADGTVWDWGGYAPYPALGNGTTLASPTPVQVSGLSNVTAVATAEYFGFHSLALKNDGTVWAWGPNFDGQIGDGTTTDRSTPVQVTGLTGITALAASNAGSFALKSDGTVWAWGQIAADSNSIAITSPTPMQVQGLSNVIAIAAGRSHCLALEKDGTVWAWATDWDGNFNGQLGNGTTTVSYTPAQVMSLSGVTDIGAGGYHSLAKLSDGTLWTWGKNSSGQLGDGTTTDQSTPVQVEGLVLQ